jgi:4-amino-4-deoxy-L-arabinose transferase-like glycosyltransferase
MSSEPTTPAAARVLRAWPLVVIVALAPLWLIGIFHRGLWTPDEPREADIAWRMSQQADRTLPQLAGTPFLEKPPLTYWASAASIGLFGESAGSARVPNLLYALLTALAIGALAARMRGAATAIVAALAAGTALIVFRATVWLAPDAALLCGCAVSLLGAYVGYTSAPGRSKLFGYTLMHAGAALGFMAKSAPGWLVPALALLVTVAWERRWSELRRWELYAGLILQALIIGPWIHAVMGTPQGRDALLAFFWHNVVGRFTRVSAPSSLDYTTGHQNWPGKYLFELPVYLLPWTVLTVAAIHRAWSRVRLRGTGGTSWRFTVAAVVPFLTLLSLAATARDVYAAPAVLGLAVLIALWVTDDSGPRGRLDTLAFSGTRVLVALMAGAFVIALLIIAAAYHKTSSIPWMLTAAVVILVSAWLLRLARRAQRRHEPLGSFAWTYCAYATALCLTALLVFPVVDRWQNLSALAAVIRSDTGSAPLGLLDPDETTIAVLDDHLRTPFDILSTQGSSPERVVSDWFAGHGSDARVLVLLPGHARGELTEWLERVRPVAPPGDGVAGALVSAGAAQPVRSYELPEGRRYALLRAP